MITFHNMILLLRLINEASYYRFAEGNRSSITSQDCRSECLLPPYRNSHVALDSFHVNVLDVYYKGNNVIRAPPMRYTPVARSTGSNQNNGQYAQTVLRRYVIDMERLISASFWPEVVYRRGQGWI